MPQVKNFQRRLVMPSSQPKEGVMLVGTKNVVAQQEEHALRGNHYKV